MDLANANILSYLYGTLIQPILHYGCELWAPDRLVNINTSHGVEGKCETIQNKFMKRALGVRDQWKLLQSRGRPKRLKGLAQPSLEGLYKKKLMN